MTPLRLTAAALRNYARPVLWRENPFLLMAGCYTISVGLITSAARQVVARHGIHALFGPHAPPMTIWWLVTWALPAGLTFHYWRQARAEQAVAIPYFIAAERLAITLMLLLALALLMAPFLYLGAPFFGTLALASIGMVMGGATGNGAKTGQGARIQKSRAFLVLPFMLLGFLPNFMARVVFAPWPVDLGLTALAAFLLITSLQFRPAMAALQEDHAEHARDSATARPNRLGARLIAMLLWRPRFMIPLALPASFGVPLGPVGILAGQFVPMALFLGLMPLAIALLKGRSYEHAAQVAAPTILPLLLSLGLSSAGQWLMQRADWPPLFCAGLYGSRKGFAEALFSAHRLNLLQTALISTALAMLAAWALHVLPGAEILPAALIACGLIFGGGYCCALPLLWRELGGKGMIMACTMAGYMAAYFTLLFTVFLFHTLWLAAWIAAAMMIFGLTMGRLAPSRLAAIDWPLESD